MSIVSVVVLKDATFKMTVHAASVRAAIERFLRDCDQNQPIRIVDFGRVSENTLVSALPSVNELKCWF